MRDLRETATFGWLKRWVDLARPANSFIIAYVVTTLEHDGAHVAYEGIVENIALDDNRAITMLVLSRCDRFLVRVSADRVERIEGDEQPEPQRLRPVALARRLVAGLRGGRPPCGVMGARP